MPSITSSRFLFNQGVSAHLAGNIAQAAELYQQILSCEEQDPLALTSALNNLAAIRQMNNNHAEAEDLYRRSLEIWPDHVDTLIGLGVLLQQQDRIAAAIQCLQHAADLAPNSAEAHMNLGICLTIAGRQDAAEAALLSALRLSPDDATILFNLAFLIHQRGRSEQALDLYDRTLALQPTHIDAMFNRCLVLDRLGRREEVIAGLDHALTIEPDNAKVAWNLSLALLFVGDYERGWQLYESRWGGHAGMATGRRPFTQPQWNGVADPQGCLLVHCEQGFGDTIQFARYMRDVLARYQGNVVMEVQPSLIRLLSHSFQDERLRIVERAADFPNGSGLPAFTAHIPLLSLPHLFSTTLGTIPKTMPYLRPPTHLVELWRQPLQRTRGVLRCGLVWRGAPTNSNDKDRSLSLEDLAPLMSVSDVEWFLLQKQPHPVAPSPFADQVNVTDLGIDLTDFAETAAIIQHLDVIITVDTAVAHLAGACKRPTWILLSQPFDWRWLQDRKSSPWYPSATLFRQPTPGDWATTIADAARRLQVLATV